MSIGAATAGVVSGNTVSTARNGMEGNGMSDNGMSGNGMSGNGAAARAGSNISTAGRATGGMIALSASGILPVTDCTNAIVCAIRRSRSFIHFMKHLGPSHSIKQLLWNQAAAEVTVDNTVAFAREVTKR
ncbi:hypothetical protein [Bradyrhizobium jicamae]|uniref:hypothetical protein n=1 Tax=Bradyrhizobium jicamae TaxID=280332 RepID=UPI0012ED6874|nr:hypothetical protein [Bradyrhizobium jicamae]